MKVKKRVLSAVLAATMLVTSLSAGLSALAAEANADPYQTLADALQADGVKNAAWGSEGSNPSGVMTVVEDPTGEIETAAEAFWAVVQEVAPKHAGEDPDRAQGRNYYSAYGMVQEILETLQNSYGVTGDALSNATTVLHKFVGNFPDDANYRMTRLSDPALDPGTYGLRIVHNVGDLLLSMDPDVSKLPDVMNTAVEYTYPHDVQRWNSALINHNAFHYLRADGWSKADAGANTEIPAALKAFGAFFDDHLGDDLDAMTGDELQALRDAAQAQVDALAALGLWGNDEVMNHFFDKDAIQDFINSVKTKVDVAYARSYVGQIAELMEKNDPADMKHEDLVNLHNQLTELRTNLQGLTADAQNTALTEAGLTWDEINAYIASVNEEIEVDKLEGYKANVDAVIAGIPQDLTTATDEQLASALAQAQQQWALISACTQGAIDRVFTDGTAYVTEFIQNVQVEMEVRELESGLVDFGAYFAVHMETDLTTVATDDLLDNYREPDRAKFENEVKQYSPAALDRVYGEGWYASVEAYIASIDATLTARVEAQIDEAVNNYQEFGQITIRNYRAVKDAIGGVETRIIEVLGLSEEYQAKYDQFSAYSEELKAFEESKGLNGWVKTDVEYPTRESMPGDIARNPEETYTVTPENLNTVISKIDSLMQNEDLVTLLTDLGVTGLNGTVANTIKSAVEDNLYTNELINTVITKIYPALINAINGINIDTGVMGIVIKGSDLLPQLKDLGIMVYPGTLDDVVVRYVGEHPEWQTIVDHLQAIDFDWTQYDMNTDWGVHDQASFVEALSVALGGLEPVLKMALTNQALTGSVKFVITADLTVDGMSLYEKAVYPLLQALGCENLVDVATYNTYTQGRELLSNILNPLLTWVTETVANNPISTVLDILPKLAYIMQMDLITAVLQNTAIDGSIKALAGIVNIDLGDTISGALGSNNLYGILSGVIPADSGIDLKALGDINKLIPMILNLVAPDANLVLPTIDQGLLASLGNIADAGNGHITYTSDKPAVLVTVLRYVLNMVGDQDFMDSLFALIGKLTGTEINLGDDVMNIITGLGENPDGVICALTELFVPYENGYAATPYQPEGENGETLNPVTYSDAWTQDQAQYLADNFDEFVDDMMLILGGSGAPTLSELIRGYIADQFYTNETITSLVLTVKNLIDGIGIDVAPILSLVGVSLDSWQDVTEGYDWGVTPGDTASFANGLKAALEPFAPIVATLLSGEKDLSILGTVTLKSYPGYANGIIPLLENLGCADADIMSAAEYQELAAKGNYDQMISAIINPILNLVDRVYENPIDTLMEILPNLLYFIHNGGLQACVENTAQSAFVLLDTIRPVYDLNFSLDLDLEQILVDLVAGLEVNGQQLNLKIPFLSDLSLLATGTIEEYNSKSGTVSKHLVVENKADFVTALLRNVVELLFYEDNLNTIGDLIANATGLDATVKENLQKIINAFAELYHQNNGVDKILHAAYVIFKGADQAAGGSIAAIKDFNERWSAVFDQMYQSGGFLKDFAEWADETLDFLSFGAINGDGIGTSGLIDFFDRVAAFFQGRVTSVSIDRTSADMLVGDQVTLSLSFKPVTVKNKNVTWASSRNSIATVENGVVTAVGVGDAEITATTEDGGFVVSCVVRVRADKTALNAAIARAESLELTADQKYNLDKFLLPAKEAAADELASQEKVDYACEALLSAIRNTDLGTPVDSVVITQNGAPVGEVVYQKVPWTKKWNSTPVTLGVQINGGNADASKFKSVTWQYADWSANKPEADIEAAADNMSAVIRAKNSVIGAHSCWIQVTVVDNYGNSVTSNPVKVRFYNYDWQK